MKRKAQRKSIFRKHLTLIQKAVHLHFGDREAPWQIFKKQNLF
jgi:hypothetical protein